MPCLKIETNLSLNPTVQRTLIESASALVARELGKPESYVMVTLQPDVPMLFAGSVDPVAFLELMSIGLPGGKTRQFSRALCGLIEEQLGVPGNRIYVRFVNAEPNMWGWNGDVF